MTMMINKFLLSPPITFPNRISKPTTVVSFHNTTISTPPPIRGHSSLTQSATRLLPTTTTDSLLFFDRPDEDYFQLHLLEPLFDGGEILDNHRIISHRYPGDDSSYVIGSSNGLVCITDGHFHSASILVCNPVTGEYVTLPPHKDDDQYHDVDGVQFGFAFDHNTNQYKFFRMFMDSNQQVVAHLHTLGGGGGGGGGGGASPDWTTLETPPYSPYMFITQQIYVHGAFHWMVENDFVIMSFHLGTHDYDFLPLSPELAATCDASRNCNLMALGGYLAIVVYTFYLQIQIWIMKEYGDQDSWTKQFVFPIILDPTKRCTCPIDLMKYGNLLLQALCDGGDDLVCYDPVTKTIRNNLGLHKTPCHYFADEIPHTRSSVSPKDIVAQTDRS